MGLEKRGSHWYGQSQADIRMELARYAELVGYPAEHFADARCVCDGRLFSLELDEAAGVAVRSCTSCAVRHAMADGAEFLDDAELEACACPCGAEAFELTVGAALYADSSDVRWLYVGARCPTCDLTACYGDWKCEFPDVHALLALT